MDKYAIYLRKSRADEEAEKLGEGETLARHKKILTELAARKGLYVEKIYHEIVSGETISARPEMKKMISDCYDGKYKGIIVVDVDRLSRGNQADMQTIMDMLKYSNNRNGLLIVTPTKTYDVAHNYDDEEYIEFVLFMSRREYKTILKRLERGKKQAVVEGNYMGSYRPYGYDILKNRTGRTLIPNVGEAPVVKNIFEWHVNEGLTAGKIAKRLTSLGVPTYTGASYWSAETIKSILINPIYIGKVRWNTKMQVKKMVNGEVVKSRLKTDDSEHYMLHDGKHKAIVSEDLFEKAKGTFHADKTRTGCTLKNPLAGILCCGKCKRMMQFRPIIKGRAARYTHQFSTGCNIKSVAYKDIMDAFIHALSLYIDDFEMKIDNLPLVDENTIQGQISTLEKEIKKVERKLSKLFDSWEDDLISNNEFVERKEKHNTKIVGLKNQIEELEAAIPQKEEFEERIFMLSDALSLLKDETLDASIKNEFLKKIIDRIEYNRENDEEFTLDIFLKD